MDTKKIGRRIASARLSVGYKSAAEFAAVLGKSAYTVRDYESGRITPPTDVLSRIAELTGKTVQWLLDESDNYGPDKITVQVGSTNVTGDVDTIRQLIQGIAAKEDGPLQLQNEEGPDKGVIEFLDDVELCNTFKLTDFERAVITSIRGGAIKRKEQALSILLTLRS